MAVGFREGRCSNVEIYRNLLPKLASKFYRWEGNPTNFHYQFLQCRHWLTNSQAQSIKSETGKNIYCYRTLGRAQVIIIIFNLVSFMIQLIFPALHTVPQKHRKTQWNFSSEFADAIFQVWNITISLESRVICIFGRIFVDLPDGFAQFVQEILDRPLQVMVFEKNISCT